MKKSLILIALAMVAALSVVSCKNNNKSKEPTQEEIQEQKQALADSVLAKIDEFAAQYIGVSDKADILESIILTDEEKMVKPDYLLDPSEASKFVTKKQKVNALAIYTIEQCVRILYDMPMDEVKEVIAKLALELNHPIDGDFLTSDKLASEYVQEEYKMCKERGEIAYFWQFQNAVMRETDYLLAKNPELYLSKISEDNYQAWDKQWLYFYRAIWAIAPYDEEINQIFQTLEFKTDEDYASSHDDFSSKACLINTYKSDKYQLIEKRNALLQ